MLVLSIKLFINARIWILLRFFRQTGFL